MHICVYCLTLLLQISILQKIDCCVDDSGLLGCDAKSLGKWFPLYEGLGCLHVKSSRSIEGEGNVVPHPRRCKS